jgi:hypothetical protein
MSDTPAWLQPFLSNLKEDLSEAGFIEEPPWGELRQYDAGRIAVKQIEECWLEDREPVESDVECPKCGSTAVEQDEVAIEMVSCGDCGEWFEAEKLKGGDVTLYGFDHCGTIMTQELNDSFVVIHGSRYYRIKEDGLLEFCLGGEWFQSGVAPYPYYRVEDGELVEDGEV